MGVAKLWPLNGSSTLVVGEGIETVLAAATRLTYRGEPLVPAWSAIAKGGLRTLPPLPVTQLILLVDNDENGEGQKAAAQCRDRLQHRTVVPLIPKQVGFDFNDVVLRRPA